MKERSLLSALAVCCAAEVAAGQVVPIGPFVGDRREPLNLVNPPIAIQQFGLFSGTVTLMAPTATAEFEAAAVKIELGGSLGGDTATPRTGAYMMSVLYDSGDPRMATFVFSDLDVNRFGGYFNNNSPTDHAVFEFYDHGRNLIGTYQASIPKAGNVWYWHGWESSVPIHRVTYKGLSPAPFSGGFIWFDDLELGRQPAALQGACCLESGTCQVLTQTDCDAIVGAQYQGDNTTCIEACEPAGGCEEDCAGMTPDGQVDVADLLALLANWGPGATCDVAPAPSGDGVINVTDLLALLAAWGSCP
jgi:hypothetical protein